MPVTDLLIEGVELMFLGMGSVFIFLAVLVFVLKGMSRLAQAMAPEELPAGAVSSAVDEDDELLAVISAAIARYRSQHKQ
ncbi:MAG: OadG family protein [Chromatiaceae bacterium]|nr:OadG family protein [Gammaproteobacteria bacterium]MCP5445543.1 OadG family protein [Chromatiaceae bacterium]MCB1860661.1 OadG family protein [Gammaproteobacteria bacterium]MCB1874023.1 OadG family protein [Gammaproteobacteria bacterium]MCB1879192.1 OadG family protein [Gammaproteobacteria bacterium]